MKQFEPGGSVIKELVEKRSRFVATVSFLATTGEVKGAIQAARLAHPRASHVVHVFVIGSGNSCVEGLSDDGEPKGTAGRPILELLKGRGLTNLLVLVVRYFGGTKLGTGGLARAYAEAARIALDQTTWREVRQSIVARIACHYDVHRLLEAWLKSRGIVVITEDFGETVRLELEINNQTAAAFGQQLRSDWGHLMVQGRLVVEGFSEGSDD